MEWGPHTFVNVPILILECLCDSFTAREQSESERQNTQLIASYVFVGLSRLQVILYTYRYNGADTTQLDN